jgi:thioredoxin 1
MSANTPAVTGADFDAEVLQSPLPVLVDFWAVWCGPCRMVTPTVEQIADEYVGRIKVVKVDVDDNMEISSRYGIQSIPTLMLFKGGQPVERLVGAYPKPAILAKIQQHL